MKIQKSCSNRDPFSRETNGEIEYKRGGACEGQEWKCDVLPPSHQASNVFGCWTEENSFRLLDEGKLLSVVLHCFVPKRMK